MENDNSVERMPNDIPPFVKFCCANVPAVFDDSLSYYEALCALWKYLQDCIDVINNNALLEEEYIEKFELLKSYVEHYFDNLDVQSEINNKLDKMAEDGTLTIIVMSYIQPQFDVLEEHVEGEISGIRNQLTNMVNYQPIPVATTADMTDTSRIYVLTTNGKWYYYDTNETEWTAGGTYQSVAIGDGTIDGSKLYNGEASFKYTPVDNAYINDQGEVAASQYYYYFSEYIPITTGDSYEINSIYGRWCAVYDSDKHWIATYSVSNSEQDRSGTITAEGVSYIRLMFAKSLGYNHYFKVNGVDVLNSYNVDWLKIKTSNLDFTPDGLDGDMLIDESVTSNKLLLSMGEPVTRGSYWTQVQGEPWYAPSGSWSRFTNLIDVQAGDVVEGKSVRASWAVFFDENGDGIGAVPRVEVTGNDSFVVNSSTYKLGFNIENINIAQCQIFINGKEIQFDNRQRKTIDWLELNEEQKGSVTNYDIKRFEDYKVLFIGDSITEHNFRASSNWVDYLTSDLKITNYLNGGMSGTGILKTFGDNPNWMTKLATYDNDYDLILIMGDMNDWSNNGSFTEDNIGEFGDSTTATFYGTMKVYLEALLTKYPLAKIGWITSTPRNSQVGDTNDYLHGKTSAFSKGNDVIKEMCNNYSIPVLELYNESNLYPWIAANNQYYFKPDVGEYVADGVHPNSKAQQLMEYKIKDFVIRNF